MSINKNQASLVALAPIALLCLGYAKMSLVEPVNALENGMQITQNYPESQTDKSQVAQNSSPKILIVVTNHDRLGTTGRKTGFYLDEVAHLHAVFTQAGFEVDFVSPTGEEAPIDPKSYDLTLKRITFNLM